MDGVFGGRSCGKQRSAAYTYYPFIDKCHPAPGRNITLQLIASRAALLHKTLTGMCRHGSPMDGDGLWHGKSLKPGNRGGGTAEMIAVKGERGRGCVAGIEGRAVSRCVGSKVLQ